MFKIAKKIFGIFAALSIILFSISQTSFATEDSNERNLDTSDLYYYPKDQGPILSVDDKVISVSSGESSQDPAGNQHLSWGIATMQVDVFADYVKNSTDPSDSIIVAVVDSGVNADHPLLQGRVLDNGYDFVNDDPDPADDLGHGTHVAGTIADCTQGLDVKILPVKVLSHQNEGYASNIACGIRYAVNNGAKVINYSICGPVQYDNTFIDDAIDYALSKGVIMVAAAGNEKQDVSLYCPAHRSDIIVTSAIDQNLTVCNWGDKGPNYGNTIDVAAPGDLINSCYPAALSGNMTMLMSGTSMAAPHVTSTAAMLKLLYPTASPAQIENIIKYNAKDLGTPGYDTVYGFGMPLLSNLITDLPFYDVQLIDWYYDSVKSVYSRGYMTGRSEGYFGAAENMQRQDMAVLMYRMAGSPLVQYQDIYPDVTSSHYFANAATWNYQNGIITGQNGKLGVGNYLLRQDFANILYRYATYQGLDLSKTTDISNYTDSAQVSSWTKTAVEWAVANGLMGQGVSELRPLDNINRAEIAAIISRFESTFNL